MELICKRIVGLIRAFRLSYAITCCVLNTAIPNRLSIGALNPNGRQLPLQSMRTPRLPRPGRVAHWARNDTGPMVPTPLPLGLRGFPSCSTGAPYRDLERRPAAGRLNHARTVRIFRLVGSVFESPLFPAAVTTGNLLSLQTRPSDMEHRRGRPVDRHSRPNREPVRPPGRLPIPVVLDHGVAGWRRRQPRRRPHPLTGMSVAQKEVSVS